MPQYRLIVLSGLGAVILASLVVWALPAGGPAQKQSATLPVPEPPIDPKYVCMVGDAYMGIERIPVPVGEKTYYGCRESSVAKLQGNPLVRHAVDPITGKDVDKVEAYIAFKPGQWRDVLYFESEANHREYIAQMPDISN